MAKGDFSELERVLKAKYDEFDSRIQDLQSQIFDIETERDRFTDTLMNAIAAVGTPRPLLSSTSRPSRPQGAPTAEERILTAKRQMSGEWQRSDLHEKVNADGNGEMPLGTFAPAFAKLAKEGAFIEVKPRSGSSAAAYRSSEDVQENTVPSTMSEGEKGE